MGSGQWGLVLTTAHCPLPHPGGGDAIVREGEDIHCVPGVLIGTVGVMKTTIDKAGRVVIPKAIREAAGLTPGTELNFRCEDGRIEIEPAAVPVKLVRRPGGMLVAVPLVPGEPLPHEVVEWTFEELRNERGQIRDC